MKETDKYTSGDLQAMLDSHLGVIQEHNEILEGLRQAIIESYYKIFQDVEASYHEALENGWEQLTIQNVCDQVMRISNEVEQKIRMTRMVQDSLSIQLDSELVANNLLRFTQNREKIEIILEFIQKIERYFLGLPLSMRNYLSNIVLEELIKNMLVFKHSSE